MTLNLLFQYTYIPAGSQKVGSQNKKPAIRRHLKTVHRNTSVYEDVARRLQEQSYVRHAHQCRTKFKALKVAYKKAQAAVLRSGTAPQGCPFYEEMNRMLQTQVATASPKHPLEQEQEQQGDPNYSKWQGRDGETRKEQEGVPEGCPPQPYKQQQPRRRPETEHLLKAEGVERPGDLNPESQSPAEAGNDCSKSSHNSETGFQRKPDQSLSQREILSPPSPPAPVVTPILYGTLSGRVHQFPPRDRNFRKHQTVAAMIASEMAENRRLVSQLARESATQLQCLLDQHNAHMAALVQMAQDSYAQHQEVVAILQDVADDVHEGVAKLLRSSVDYLGHKE
ncbi:myb/SANT-like DNA-binding domain-containing protein 7 [Antechinus flavipes]|uniref:myb/SANT-like DNA-binding domain-containing protein 7 n=1 Tax=Antechinus flavipes TaxID=38775 RepID=UPI0022363DE2|nr:myb/SANT-like DNA-binding domain-containing protein 7 [Antechinus flavipes]